jgi:hypothetical protein
VIVAWVVGLQDDFAKVSLHGGLGVSFEGPESKEVKGGKGLRYNNGKASPSRPYPVMGRLRADQDLPIWGSGDPSPITPISAMGRMSVRALRHVGTCRGFSKERPLASSHSSNRPTQLDGSCPRRDHLWQCVLKSPTTSVGVSSSRSWSKRHWRVCRSSTTS